MEKKGMTQEQKDRLAKCRYYKGEKSHPEIELDNDISYYYWESERMYTFNSPDVSEAWEIWDKIGIEKDAENKRPDIPLRLQFYLLGTAIHLYGSLFNTNIDAFKLKYFEFIMKY